MQHASMGWFQPVVEGSNRPKSASFDRLQTVSDLLLGHGRNQLRDDDLQPRKLENSNKTSTQRTIESKKIHNARPNYQKSTFPHRLKHMI